MGTVSGTDTDTGTNTGIASGTGTAADLFADDPILEADPEGLPVLHDREYRVRAYRMAPDRILLRGAVRDQKPPGLYLPDDPEPLTVHHMQLSLEVAFPSLVIEAASVDFETHPERSCPSIVEHYGGLVGLSIARGFTHRVRELFGGPRGCTHVTALLQAMAPVAVQTMWSMRSYEALQQGGAMFPRPTDQPDDGMWRGNVNTCHVWAEDGEVVAAREAGEPWEVPVFLRDRLEQLGIDPTTGGTDS